MIFRYATYDQAGNLTGCFWQELHPDHEGNYLSMTAEQAADWTAYKANAARNGLEAATPAEDVAAVVSRYMAAVQRHMDALAVSFGYDNLLAVISYAEEPAVARYQNEGLAFRAWRSLCWSYCEQVFADVQAESRGIPTEAELVAELPTAPTQEPE